MATIEQQAIGEEVEIVGDAGETLDLVTVPVEQLKLVEKHS